MEITPEIEIEEIKPDLGDQASKAIRFYDKHAVGLVNSYESLCFETVYPYIIEHLSKLTGSLDILDIGSGTGRDAAWMAGQGYRIIAVDPSMSMLDIARDLHSNPGIQWIQDRLPDLGANDFTGAKFDMILCNAVWMHIAPNDRINALKRIKSLLTLGGSTFITVRLGPENKGRGAWALSISDFIRDVQKSGLEIVSNHDIEDILKRPYVSWKAFEIKYLKPV